MLAVFVNMATVLAGSLIGILFRSRLKPDFTEALLKALALCTAVIGIISAIATKDVICIIICTVLGTAIGELLHIHSGIERMGELAKKKLTRADSNKNSRFTEGFVTACIVFCVGSMTIMGSIEAGVNGDYSIIFAKSALDFVSSLAFGAAMGFGVTCSVVFILIFQGGLTLLGSFFGNFLSDASITEMSAIGGTILLGLAINMLDLGKKEIRVANMLPAVFLPPLYFLIKGLIL